MDRPADRGRCPGAGPILAAAAAVGLSCWIALPHLFGKAVESVPAAGPGGTDLPAPERRRLVLYCGRSKTLVEDLLARFEEASGIEVAAKWGDTAELAVLLLQERAARPAGVFWAQDAGALGAVAEAGLFEPLPSALLDRVPPAFRSAGGIWGGV